MDTINPEAYGFDRRVANLWNSLFKSLRNRALSAPGLVIGSSSAAKVKIGATTAFLSDGVFKSKTTAEIAFTATTHDIPADADVAQEAWYLVMLAADGTPSLVMGTIADDGLAKLPALPATGTCIGAVKISVAAGATPFDASTDELSAEHLTDTYVDYGFLHPLIDTVL